MTIFIIISLVIIAALFSAKSSLKDNDHPTITGIITAPIFLEIKYLVTWGTFALVNLFTPPCLHINHNTCFCSNNRCNQSIS